MTFPFFGAIMKTDYLVLREAAVYYYRVYGIVMETDIEFMQLVKADAVEAPDIMIRAGILPEYMSNHPEQKKYEFGETLSWLNNRTCTFMIENGKIITYQVKEGAREGYLQTYLLGFGLSMLFLQRGEMAVHCSALHNGKEAILIAGESGSGKSTTTDAYLEAGWKLMADDMAVVKLAPETKVPMVYPAFPFTKLCRNAALERGYALEELIYIDEEKDKFLVPYKGEFELTPKPLSKFLLLSVQEGEEVVSKEITGFDKFHVCVNNLFLRRLLGPRKYAPAIGQKCLEIIANVEVYMLTRPKGKDTKEEIKKAVFDIIL